MNSTAAHLIRVKAAQENGLQELLLPSHFENKRMPFQDVLNSMLTSEEDKAAEVDLAKSNLRAIISKLL